MAIDTVVFDFGGVLINWNPRNYYRRVFADDEKMEWFLSSICTNEWNVEQDRGRPLAEGTRILRERFPEHGELIESYYGNWEKMLDGEIGGAVALLHELRGKYPLYGLTNWSAETFPVARGLFPFLGHFRGIVVSGEEKLIKPDPRIYQVLLDRYGLCAEKCLFIDDSAANIAAAKELGFHTAHFTGPENLREDLARRGLL